MQNIQNIVEALLKKESYPEGEVLKDSIELKETHISWVFLTGEFAYKVKKPVNFGFLDFTTLKKRKFFCEEEIRLNKRLSPDIYIKVVPIAINASGKVCIDKISKDDKVIEYAVKMKELPQEAILKTRLQKNEYIYYETSDKIAKEVARFHRGLPKPPEKIRNKYASILTIKYNWQEHFTQTQDLIGRIFDKESFYLLRDIIYTALEEKKYIFIERLQRVRRCHGDLHSANIFILDKDKVYIFDCIEFNLRFVYSDVANEVAFLAMDFEFYKYKHLSDYFIYKYMTYTEDYSLLRVLDFYKSYRAYVRAKVLAFQAQQEKDSYKNEELIEEAKKYFELSLLYANSINATPKLIMIMGLPGVGKSYISYNLAYLLNFVCLTTDIIRKDIAGLYPEEDRTADFGEGLYSTFMTKKTYEELLSRANIYIKHGIGCILDGTFLTSYLRKMVVNFVRERGLERVFFPILCKCREEVVLERIRRRNTQMRSSFPPSEATLKIYEKMKQQYDEPTEEEFLPARLITLNTEDIDLPSLILSLKSELK